MILAHLAQIWTAIFFSKIWLRQSLDVMFSYHVQYKKKKLVVKILRKRSDGLRKGQTDESGFIVRCPTNVELPT